MVSAGSDREWWSDGYAKTHVEPWGVTGELQDTRLDSGSWLDDAVLRHDDHAVPDEVAVAVGLLGARRR